MNACSHFKAAWIAALGLSCGLPASAAVIDFDATTPDDYLFAAYEEDGFRLTVSAGHYDFFGPGIWCNLTSGVCPNNFLNVDDSVYGPATVRLAAVDGGTFDLASLDVLDVYQYNQQTYQFSGCGAGCIVRSSLGGSQSLAAGTMNFSGPAWSGVQWIEFAVTTTVGLPTIASSAIDNINVSASAVPLPAAGWFGLTGLAALLARARRR